MRDEGWKGTEALSADETKAFWNAVSEPATDDDVETLEIGQSIYLESGPLRSIHIVRDKWVDERGLTQIRFTLPEYGEKYEAPTLTIVTVPK